MTISIAGLTNGSNALTVLAQSYSSNVQLTTQEQLDIIDGRLKAQLKDQIAAVQANDAPDNALQTSTKADITRLKKQLSTIDATQTQFSTNSNVLADINTRLEALQTAITAGDSTGFDTALGTANTDVGNLLVINPTAPFQPDGILGLKGTGLGIKNSSTYNLSTPAGQTAAQTDVNNAQALISQLFPATTNNILVAGDVATALANQINLQVATLQQLQNSSQTQTEADTANLTQLEQNREHIIQLNLGNTTLLSDEIGSIANPPPLPTSTFDVLSNAVGATTNSVNTALNSPIPAILSLFV